MLGERLRAAREAAGLTQEQLAVELGVTRNTVVRAEHDRHEIGVATLRSWAVKCGVSADSLLDIGTSDTVATKVEPSTAARASSGEHAA
jgi:transcriptional regulator with XRE-family HTH domain